MLTEIQQTRLIIKYSTSSHDMKKLIKNAIFFSSNKNTYMVLMDFYIKTHQINYLSMI